MVAKRRWIQWPGRTAQELNGVSGVAGLGGIAVGAGGLTILTGGVALAFTGVGALVVAGAVGYAVIRAYPPALRRPEELVGQVVGLSDVSNIFPMIPKLAIIGPSQAGKTTLKNRLLFDFSPITRTQRISAYVVSLQTSPPRYVAVLDGRGDTLAQQFKIASESDLICVVIDHNRSDSDPSLSDERLNEHISFLEQVRRYMDEFPSSRKEWFHILINKLDLWISASPIEKDRLAAICDQEIRMWSGARAKNADFRPHSNNSPHDIALYMDALKAHVQAMPA